MTMSLADALLRASDLEMQMLDLTDKLEQANNVAASATHEIKTRDREIHNLKDRLEQSASFLKTCGFGLNDEGQPMGDEDVLTLVLRQCEKGAHMEMFEKLNKEHPILQDAWGKYMMALRLIGLDGTNSVA